ncbi:unnamed protein product, partial [Laminaria digitata]
LGAVAAEARSIHHPRLVLAQRERQDAQVSHLGFQRPRIRRGRRRASALRHSLARATSNHLRLHHQPGRLLLLPLLLLLLLLLVLLRLLRMSPFASERRTSTWAGRRGPDPLASTTRSSTLARGATSRFSRRTASSPSLLPSARPGRAIDGGCSTR